MNHVALDRAGADHRHLDHEVVERLWGKPGQHVHLRPALDLEYAYRVGLTDHGVGLRVLGRDRGEVEGLALVLSQELEGAAHAAEHA